VLANALMPPTHPGKIIIHKLSRPKKVRDENLQSYKVEK
jgi:hypothetical protein